MHRAQLLCHMPAPNLFLVLFFSETLKYWSLDSKVGKKKLKPDCSEFEIYLMKSSRELLRAFE